MVHSKSNFAEKKSKHLMIYFVHDFDQTENMRKFVSFIDYF
jgi:hypothetical protein